MKNTFQKIKSKKKITNQKKKFHPIKFESNYFEICLFHYAQTYKKKTEQKIIYNTTVIHLIR